MTERRPWSRNDLLVAFYLYNKTSFGKISARNPEIIKVSNLLNRTPSSLSMKMANIASCDPMIQESGRNGLKGASKADKDMWAEMSTDWENFYITSVEAFLTIANKHEESESTDSNFIGRERLVQSKARIGQNQFRQIILSSYNDKCCITDLSIPKLLVASHIMPWSVKPSERLNPCNGLCLSSIHDSAFDQGLLTLNSNLEVVLSSKLLHQNNPFVDYCFKQYEGKSITLPTKFIPKEEFLAHHRIEIFQQ
ncbi:HNH endonuclease [Shewanella colwelliana]|uniref:HNH endonuclease n=1 Tax=Shewanella colwelliana TaxID=23 RepID=UPI00299D0805|nr:HNH endonuclease [Shewanella colwelliana]MDX1281326.1 HNH endonuclease [Shewanella colwelliana]